MSWLGKIMGSAVGTAAAPAEAVIKAVGSVADSLFTSDDERAKMALLLEELRQKPDLLQVELNKIEAAHPSMFVAGWRPAVGWVCVLSLLAYYPPRFILATWLWGRQVLETNTWIAPPEVGIMDILGLVGTLLGSAVIRTWEKKEGVAR